MSTKSVLLSAAVIGLAVVAALLGVGGTWALWNASVHSNPGTVQAAHFDIKVNNTSIPADGSDVAVTVEDNSVVLTPSQKVYAAVAITNATNASVPVKVEAEIGAPVPASATESLMRQNLVLRSASLNSGKCSALAPNAYATAVKSTQIARGSSATYCVEVALKPDAPSTLGGQTVNVVLPLTVSQLPAGT